MRRLNDREAAPPRPLAGQGQPVAPEAAIMRRLARERRLARQAATPLRPRTGGAGKG